MIAHDSLLAGVPKGLRDPLLDEYRSLMRAFMESRWKYSGLDAGRFCEVAYTILHGYVTGAFADTPSKPDDFPGSCRALMSKPSVATGDRSMRLLIPSVLPPVYEVRNNRNVGHVGGEVASNKMDAAFVTSSCTFVVAELIRVFHNCSVEDAQETVDALVERKSPLIWEFDGGKRVLDTALKAADKVLVLLYSEPGWVGAPELISWIKYTNPTQFRATVLTPLDRALMIEFDQAANQCMITPMGMRRVEDELLDSAVLSEVA